MPPKNRFKRRNAREEKEFEEYLLQLDRVTRVVKGGRRMRFRATVIIGDRVGQVGLGLGKGNDVQIAIRKAVAGAKKNLIQIPIVKETIPHQVKLKYKAARILILPASPGTGLIAGSAIRKMLELAGVKNILSKNFGTQNRVVLAQAMLKALQELRMTEAAEKFLAGLKKAKKAVKNLKEQKRIRHAKVGMKAETKEKAKSANKTDEKAKLKDEKEVGEAQDKKTTRPPLQ